ncbi:hypothetical protein [Limnohabitans sp. 103DPR2]|uniref:hypothetical protein n=1 Tax=Limnohabitans sp. 103DPR2 TaxID=1678129 RepID=UPI0006DC00F2|nr:hypothetical protein [Limnohabitans sp. 103DPR2]ALK92007.1 hypothetical protein L103DPR2_01607 [Limnohabitans sp. 103DPR2]
MSQLFLLDSIAHISNAHANAIVISGSHGGKSAAEFVIALSQKPSCVFFNDAGGGKDNAGKVALEILQAHNVPCACYSHLSARIGDAQDGYDNGVVSAMNELAQLKGVELNMPVKVAMQIDWSSH